MLFGPRVDGKFPRIRRVKADPRQHPRNDHTLQRCAPRMSFGNVPLALGEPTILADLSSFEILHQTVSVTYNPSRCGNGQCRSPTEGMVNILKLYLLL